MNNQIGFLINILTQQYGNDPMVREILGMVNTNNVSGLEQFARNLCREKGVVPETLINEVLNGRKDCRS